MGNKSSGSSRFHVIRALRRISIALLSLQLLLHCWNFAPLVVLLTNFLMISVLFSEIRRLDSYELLRLSKLWMDGNVLQCAIQVFTLLLLSALHIMLAHLARNSKGIDQTASEFVTEACYYLLIAVSLLDNCWLFFNIISARKGKPFAGGLAHNWRRNAMLLMVAAPAA